MFGIFFGTYSSVFVATPLAYDLMHKKLQKEAAASKAK
jgi:preprotein translocase subunit SecF